MKLFISYGHEKTNTWETLREFELRPYSELYPGQYKAMPRIPGMTLVETVFINRPAAEVWAFLVQPANMPLWNPKVKRVSPSSFSEPQQGYRYAITYQMHERAKASEFLAEFVRFEPPTRLVIRHTGGPHNSVIEEIYEMSERRGNLPD